MTLGFRILALAILYLIHLVSAIDVVANAVVTDAEVELDFLDIEDGVFYTILNTPIVAIVGTVNNRGQFFITSNENELATVFAMTGGFFRNSGTVSFDSLSTSVISTYDILTVGDFYNQGDMYFGIGGDEVIGAPYTVTSVTDWINEGMMVFRKDSGPSAPVVLGQVAGSEGIASITNDGSICLYNTIWLTTTSIDGSGCIQVDSESTLELPVPLLDTLFTVAPEQTIYLADSTSKLSVLAADIDLFESAPYTVAGFGNGNEIELETGFTSFSYDEETGILTLVFGLLDVEFDIGLGYDADLFETDGILLSTDTISYSGAPPNLAPAVCSCTSEFPVASTTITEEPSSSVVESATDSVVESATDSVVESATDSVVESATDSVVESATDSVVESATDSVVESATDSVVESATDSVVESATDSVVESATDSVVESATDSVVESATDSVVESATESVSEAATGSLAPGVTTTYTTTNSDGSVETNTGVVIETTDSAGVLTTLTSLIVPSVSVSESDAATGSLAPGVTTTYTTTNSDGSVETNTGVVIETTDSAGVLTTLTSLIVPSVSVSESDAATGSLAPGVTTTYTTTNSDGSVETNTGVVIETTDSAGVLTTLTSLIVPSVSVSESDAATGSLAPGVTTTYTTTNSDGSVETNTGVVIETTDSAGVLTTLTSLIVPSVSVSESDAATGSLAPGVTTTYTTTNSDGSVETNTGVVIETTDSAGVLTTLTSLIVPSVSVSESDAATGSLAPGVTTTYTTTNSDGSVETNTGVVIETTDSAGVLTTLTSLIVPSVSVSESDAATGSLAPGVTTTYTTTNSDGSVETNTGVVIETTDSAGVLTTLTSLIVPSVSVSESDAATGSLAPGVTTTYTTTNSDGSVETNTGVVIETTDSAGVLTTLTSLIVPSVSVSESDAATGSLAPGVTTTYTTTNSDGSVETNTGVVIETTDSAGMLTTLTSLIVPSVSVSKSMGPQYTKTYTVTKTDGSVETICDVEILTTDSMGSWTTTTSKLKKHGSKSKHMGPQHTKTYTVTKTDGSVETICDVEILTTDSMGSWTTTTSKLKKHGSKSKHMGPQHTKTYTVTKTDGSVETICDVEILTTDSMGSWTTTTSKLKKHGSKSKHMGPQHTKTYTVTKTDGSVETICDVEILTTDSMGSWTTTTSKLKKHGSKSKHMGPQHTKTYTVTKTDGSVETICDVEILTTDSMGSWTTTTSKLKKHGSKSKHMGPQHTKTYTVTKTDGSVETICDVEILTTDSMGSWTTTTSKVTTHPAASESFEKIYSTEIYTTASTIVYGPSSSVVTMATLTQTVCVNCATDVSNDATLVTKTSADVLTNAASSLTMDVSQTSSVSVFEGMATSGSMILSMFIVPLLAFLF